jgi:two-component system chemotaxis response regulator CheY
MAPRARILIVDDDEAILEFMGEALNDEGYEVTTALNGAEGLAVAARLPPDLVLLDMRMPLMDGWEFAKKYRETPGPHAAIVVITAARDAAASAHQIGAQGYLAKPFSLDALLETAERYARREAPSPRESASV